MHAFTTRTTQTKEIRENTLEICIDYLSVGIDPKKSVIFIQSEIPAIAELTFLFSMLIPYPRLMRNPTLKDEIRDKDLGDNYPFGFLLYPVGQVADILAFRPNLVPVGEDQLPHLELTREVARKFNQLYCHVDSQTPDQEVLNAGGLFPIIQPKLGRNQRLVGIGPPNKEGKLLKMSKSLHNAIFLSDDPDCIRNKVMSMYTDPSRLRVSDPGKIENNPLWVFHETFNSDQSWIEEHKALYRQGKVGDVACKKKLIEVLIDLIEPIRQRRLQYAKDKGEVMNILQQGTKRANEVAEETLEKVKLAIHQDYFSRKLY